jgi:hypothetical protein
MAHDHDHDHNHEMPRSQMVALNHDDVPSLQKSIGFDDFIS